MNNEWFNWIFSTVVVAFVINLISHFASKKLEVWQSNRSLVSARKSVNRLTNELDAVGDFVKNETSFYLHLFTVVLFILSLVGIQITLFAFSFFMMFYGHLINEVDSFIRLVRIFGLAVFVIGSIPVYLILIRTFKTMDVIYAVLNHERHRHQVLARIEHLKQKHKIEIQ